MNTHTLHLYLQKCLAYFHSRKGELLWASVVTAFLFAVILSPFLQSSQNSSYLMASVANTTNLPTFNHIHTNADIALIKVDNTLYIIAGKDMKKVSKIEGFIASSDEDTNSLPLSQFITLEVSSPGLFHFSREYASSDIHAGDIIGILPASAQTLYTLTDTQFIADWIRYNLTSEFIQ